MPATSEVFVAAEAPASPQRHHLIDALRAFAAISVALFHFTNGNPDLLPEGSWLSVAGRYGALGVDVFFVISGFVIPHALAAGGYRLRSFGAFIGKRVLRLDPPFFAALALALFLGWLSSRMPTFRGQPFSIDWTSVALHLGYLTAIAGRHWQVPAFWTLGLEFQFYLTMAILFPLLDGRRSWTRVVPVALFAIGSLWAPFDQRFVFAYGPWFAAGMLVFLRRERGFGAVEFLVCIAATALLIARATSPLHAAVTACTALLIAFVPLRRPRFASLAALSYSLYLVHEPVGGRVVNFAVHYPHRSALINVGVVALALSVALFAAWLLYRFVERPAQKLASTISYASPPPLALATTR